MRTFVVDIYGTLLDETGSLVAETGDQAFAEAWEERVGLANRAVRTGEEQWRGSEEIRRAVLAELLTENPVADYQALKDVAARFAPFPDAPEGLTQLAAVAQVVGLTNTEWATAARASANAGLRWHALLSTQLARTFKPHPEAYRLVEDLLGVDPAQSVFVAAHPWDLRAAAKRGYTTAYLPRGDQETDEFDHVVRTVGELAALAS